MTSEPLTAPSSTNLDQAHDLMREHKKKALPLLNSDGTIAGMYSFSGVRRIKTGSSSTYNLDNRGQLRVGAAIGVGPNAIEHLEILLRKHVDVVVIDTAHGDSLAVLETLKLIKKKDLAVDVVAGNISEPESAARLIRAGADGIKVGQGPGSICTTRPVAGIGCPQVTAVYYCARAARESGIPVCADGGIRYSGDIPIAIGAGASSVMLGKILAQTTESPGEVIFREGRSWKFYRGMGSASAMKDHKASRERYSQTDKFVPEGVESLIPYSGDLEKVIHQFIGGLRAGMGYVGAATVAMLQHKADFHQITGAGLAESHPHDVLITADASSYSRRT